MTDWKGKRVLVTGASAGLGLAIARAFASAGAKLALVARDEQRLAAATQAVQQAGGQAVAFVADVTRQADVDRLFAWASAELGGLDVLVNNVGRSARGLAAEVTPEQFQELWEINFLSAVRCTRAALPHLLAARGSLVNIGSLAAKSAGKYLGGYCATKFPLAAWSQQLRLELGSQGLHVLLVCPGPIRRDDVGERYATADGLPAAAQRAGAGVKVGSIDPDWLARQIVRSCERRTRELVVPWKARLLFALAQLSPSWGDWLLEKMQG